MESHVKAHKEMQERRRRCAPEHAGQFQSEGFSKNAKILKRQTNANTKRTENENNLQILKQAPRSIRRRPPARNCGLESAIDTASMPKNLESFLNKQVPVRYIAAIREGRLAATDVTKRHERFEWPISDLVQNFEALPSESQRALQTEIDRVETQDTEGCLTFKQPFQRMCLKASEDRKRRAETTFDEQIQKARTFLDESSNELTADAAAERRELDPAGKRQKTRDEPSFEFLDDRMGGSARVYSRTCRTARTGWPSAITSRWHRVRAQHRGAAARRMGYARNESTRRTCEILQQQVHAFHGADVEDDDGKALARLRAAPRVATRPASDAAARDLACSLGACVIHSFETKRHPPLPPRRMIAEGPPCVPRCSAPKGLRR